MPDASLWEATATPGPEVPALAGRLRAQTAVIGGGYTGLSAALHLAEAGRDVVVLEAEAPGWGASGRNGGQVIPGLKYDPPVLRAMFGPGGVGDRLVGAVGGAPDLVFSLIARHGIECAAERAGWLQLAVSEPTLKTLAARARHWQAEGAGCEILDRAETARLTGSAYYEGALYDPRGGTVQPLSYARGLGRAVLGAGGRVFGQNRVRRLSRAGGFWRVETGAGRVEAETVILATNAYADELHPKLRRSVVAVPSFQVATAKLSDNVLKSILPGRQAGSDMRRLLRYFRVFDGRLLMGGRGAFADSAPASLLARLGAAIGEIYPAVAEAPIEFAWGGMVAVTPDHLPHLHVLEPGLLAGLGYNGRGVAMATLMGKVLADHVLGVPEDALAFPSTPVRPIVLHRFCRLGAQLAIAYLRLRDQLQG